MMKPQRLFKCLCLRLCEAKYRLALCAQALIIFSIGCGPKVYIAPATASLKLRTIAILPASYEANVTREKIDYIQDVFERKLSARGFRIISEDPTNADAIAKITVNKTESANLLAGNYMSLSGLALLFDLNNMELARVEHTESERGGLLFNSGQVLQGIQSTVDSFSENSFSNLADKFVEKIVSKLPSPSGTLDVVDLQVGKTLFTILENGRFKACIQSDNAKYAYIRGGKINIVLRPTENGNFCSTFLIDQSVASTEWTATLTGKYGETKNIALNQIPLKDCSLEKVIKRSNNNLSWHADINNCQDLDFIVYGANQVSGPFIYKGRLPTPGSMIKLEQPSSPVLAVVGISKKLGATKALLLK